MENVAQGSLAAARFATVLVVGFAVLAFLLALVGVYGIISYGVSQRSHELGVRKALGADPIGIGCLLLGEGARLAAMGVAIGFPAGIVLARLLSGLLYQVSPADPTVLIATPLLLGLAAVAAVLPPAWRATRIDPLVSLRQD